MPPKYPNDDIRIEQVRRPSLRAWAETIPTNPIYIDELARDVALENPQLARFSKVVGEITLCAALSQCPSPDPGWARQQAFGAGTEIGTIIVSPLFRNAPKAIKDATTHLKHNVLSCLWEMPTGPKHYRGLIQAFLTDAGAKGNTLFPDTSGALDKLTANQPNPELQQLANCGAGVVMHAIWEGYKKTEKRKMEQIPFNWTRGDHKGLMRFAKNRPPKL